MVWLIAAGVCNTLLLSSHSDGQVRDVKPAPFAPRAEAELSQLHALGALEQAPGERLVASDVLQEQLPLRLERIVRALPRGDVQPAVAKPQRVGQIGVPDGTRCIYPGLGLALAQARDRAARAAIHLQHEQLVPVDADGPRRVDLR